MKTSGVKDLVEARQRRMASVGTFRVTVEPIPQTQLTGVAEHVKIPYALLPGFDRTHSSTADAKHEK